MNKSKCPKCDAIITTVNVEDVVIHATQTKNWKGFSYSCQSCGVVLSVEMNPLALRSEIVKKTAQQTAQRLGQ